MKEKLFRKLRWYNIPVIILGLSLCAGVAIGNFIAYENSGVITQALCGISTDFNGEEVENATSLGDDLVREIAGDSFVLLKNENNALPLATSNKKVNIFGWAATNQGFLLKGIGSGSSTINPEKKVTLLDAFDEYEAEYNKAIINKYNAFYSSERTKDSGNYYLLPELKTSSFDSSFTNDAKGFSDTAIIVISRLSGENADDNCPKTQSLLTESGSEAINDKTYLQMTKYEDELITYCDSNFSKVILLVNSTNIMHLSSAADSRVDAVLYVGILGQSGAASIPKVLWGDINPSGKTADTYTYIPQTDPSFVNSTVLNNNVQYSEGIYIGYKWYETADVEHYWDGINNSYGIGYKGVVQYPFGYGKSYTNFSWELKSVSLANNSNLDVATPINLVVTVTNIGSKPGKDVVELYGKAPYKKGKIEKSSIVLLDFAKTILLEPNQSQDLTLSFRGYDLASYDCYDKNSNSFRGYELEDGNYAIQIMSDVHTLKEGMNTNTLTYKVNSTITISNDPDTNKPVSNKFTGSSAYANCPIDGSTVGLSQQYLTRANFASSFPSVTAPTPTNSTAITNAANYVSSAMSSTTMPTNSVEHNMRIVTLTDGSYASLDQLDGSVTAELKFNEELLERLNNYDSSDWENLLDQMSLDDYRNLVELGGFRTWAVESIGKPKTAETDGPAGFNYNVASLGEQNTKWTAFPSEILLGCSWNKTLAYSMGLSIGMEGQATGMNAIYAPGVNLHRSQYVGRNYEYYSEDGVISGKLASEVIRGSKTNGITMYLKHFVCDQNGKNPQNKNTWMTEQALRENYLKPFEICSKREANAIMSAFNRLGAVWCGANYNLCTGILRNEWGFKGTVVTDWYQKNYMLATKAVRAGNDMLLNFNNASSVGGRLSTSNTTDMYCARVASKHIIYTYINTNYYALTHEPDIEKYSIDIRINVQKDVFAWWILVLVAFDIIVFVGVDFLIIGLGLPLNRKNKKKKFEENQIVEQEKIE